MRSTATLLALLPLSYALLLDRPLGAPSGVRRPAAASSTVRIRTTPWPSAPGGGRRNAFFTAEAGGAEAREVGQCGCEIITVGADGLQGGERDRTRAVVSGEIFVKPEFRRQGVAQRLLREAESRARSWGVDEMILMVKAHNHPAQRLYEKMGYVREPVSKEHGNQICMRRHLFSPDMHTLRSLLPQRTTVALDTSR